MSVASVLYKNSVPYHQIKSGYAPDWLQNIQLDWANIKAVYMNKGQNKVEALVQKYPEVFQSSLGTMKSFKTHLHSKEHAEPKFFWPRAVPFAIKESVGRELDQLEEAGIV